MKKIFAVVLVLCMLMGMSALAENTTINQNSESKSANTTLTFSVSAKEEYTITIPAAVTLNASQDDRARGHVIINLDAENFNATDREIVVKLTGMTNNTFKLTSSDGNEIPYVIYKGATQIGKNSEVLNWKSSSTTKTASADLSICSSGSISNLYAGEYTDTLTFGVSVNDTSSDLP